MTAEKVDRNREILDLYSRMGWSQQRVADHFGLSQSTVSDIIARHRASLGPINKAEHINQAADVLDDLIEQAIAIAHSKPMPVTAGKDGVVVRDPETGEVVRVHSERLAAMQTVKALQESKRKLLGLDSATKVETTGSVTYKLEGVDTDAL